MIYSLGRAISSLLLALVAHVLLKAEFEKWCLSHHKYIVSFILWPLNIINIKILIHNFFLESWHFHMNDLRVISLYGVFLLVQ